MKQEVSPLFPTFRLLSDSPEFSDETPYSICLKQLDYLAAQKKITPDTPEQSKEQSKKLGALRQLVIGLNTLCNKNEIPEEISLLYKKISDAYYLQHDWHLLTPVKKLVHDALKDAVCHAAQQYIEEFPAKAKEAMDTFFNPLIMAFWETLPALNTEETANEFIAVLNEKLNNCYKGYHIPKKIEYLNNWLVEAGIHCASQLEKAGGYENIYKTNEKPYPFIVRLSGSSLDLQWNLKPGGFALNFLEQPLTRKTIQTLVLDWHQKQLNAAKTTLAAASEKIEKLRGHFSEEKIITEKFNALEQVIKKSSSLKLEASPGTRDDTLVPDTLVLDILRDTIALPSPPWNDPAKKQLDTLKQESSNLWVSAEKNLEKFLTHTYDKHNLLLCKQYAAHVKKIYEQASLLTEISSPLEWQVLQDPLTQHDEFIQKEHVKLTVALENARKEKEERDARKAAALKETDAFLDKVYAALKTIAAECTQYTGRYDAQQWLLPADQNADKKEIANNIQKMAEQAFSDLQAARRLAEGADRGEDIKELLTNAANTKLQKIYDYSMKNKTILSTYRNGYVDPDGKSLLQVIARSILNVICFPKKYFCKPRSFNFFQQVKNVSEPFVADEGQEQAQRITPVSA